MVTILILHETTTHYTTPPVACRRLRARPYPRWKTFDKVSILNSLSSGDHALAKNFKPKSAKKPPSRHPTESKHPTPVIVTIHEVLVPLPKIPQREVVKVLSASDFARTLPFFHGYLPAFETVQLLTFAGDFLLRFVEENDKVRVILSVGLTFEQSSKLRDKQENERRGWKKVFMNEQKQEEGDGKRNTFNTLLESEPRVVDEKTVLVRHYIIEEDENGVSIDEEKYFPNLKCLLAYHLFGNLEEPQEFWLRNPVNRQYGSFRSSQIKILSILGCGAYGDVALADIAHPAFESTKAAIKTIKKNHPEKLELERKFLIEGRISTHLRHNNIVRTYGFCFDSSPIQLVLEFCAGGALSTYLATQSEKASNFYLTRICLDAARGVLYLHESKILHRDIAARNCLLDATGTAKLSDFGLSVKGLYYQMVQSENLPTKYLAPECLVDFAFNTQSDVYAFGHFVCQVFNRCQEPYPNLKNSEARKAIVAGQFPQVHSRAPEALRVYVESSLFAYHPIYRPPMYRVVEYLNKVVRGLKEDFPGEECQMEFENSKMLNSLQPSVPKENVFELVEPSTATQSPPTEVPDQ
ncbi:unnamed protein product [Caenorhabditis auriculariae]|uniref:Tyrosine-protein kinase n=1 Tax=Caenorhabditis auriculariae TaxID=2777116 RepID=A0A8S1H2V3_9PELO|nr:unnamed protein product [Caenorhabditis auriculariae]